MLNNYIMACFYYYKMAGRPLSSMPVVKNAGSIFTLFKFQQNLRSHGTMADATAEQKTYHKKASGNALITVRKHSKDHELKLFGSCFW